MSSPVKTTNLFTDPVGIRGSEMAAPRWVPTPRGLSVGAGLLAVESHGVVRVVTVVVLLTMLLVLATKGRSRLVPRS